MILFNYLSSANKHQEDEDYLLYLFQQNRDLSRLFLLIAIELNYLKLISLIEFDYNEIEHLWYLVGQTGSIEMINLLVKKGAIINNVQLSRGAISKRQFNIIKWQNDRGVKMDDSKTIIYAILNGDIEFLELVKESINPSMVINQANKTMMIIPNFASFVWVFEKILNKDRNLLTRYHFLEAIKYNDLELVKYLHLVGCTDYCVVCYCQLDLLDFLYRANYNLHHVQIIVEAIKNGDNDIINWYIINRIKVTLESHDWITAIRGWKLESIKLAFSYFNYSSVFLSYQILNGLECSKKSWKVIDYLSQLGFKYNPAYVPGVAIGSILALVDKIDQ